MLVRIPASLTKLGRTHPCRWAMAISAAVSTLCGFWSMGIVGLDTPLKYDGDTLLVWLIVKTLATHSWVFGNGAMGLPTFMELNHFPMSFVGQLMVLKALLVAGLRPMGAIHVYGLATFAATAATATWAMCRLGVVPCLAGAGALAYSLLPYHFLRMPEHLFLAGYFMVPLGAYALLRLGHRDPIDATTQRGLIALCAAATLFNDIYYTFFLGYLIGAQAVFRALGQRRFGALKRSMQVLAGMLVTCFVTMLPALWALWRPGAEASPLMRPANDSEHYGLKLIQMLLPAPGHAQPWLRQMTNTYKQTAPLVTENETVSLGAVGAVCLLAVGISGFIAVYQNSNATADTKRSVERTSLEHLATLIALAFLFGTIGGLGAVLSYSATTFIRCGNRIAIIIAFFALTGGMLLLQRLGQHSSRQTVLRFGMALGIAAIVLLELGDVDYFPRRHAAALAYAQDRAFFAEVQRQLPAGARILTLPFVTFIEGGFGALDYVQALPYLHTDGFKFSFGAFRGTSGDRRNRQTAGLFNSGRDAQAIARLRTEGYDAVLVSRALTERLSPQLPRSLDAALGPPLLVSPTGDFLLYRGAPVPP